MTKESSITDDLNDRARCHVLLGQRVQAPGRHDLG